MYSSVLIRCLLFMLLLLLITGGLDRLSYYGRTLFALSTLAHMHTHRPQMYAQRGIIFRDQRERKIPEKVRTRTTRGVRSFACSIRSQLARRKNMAQVTAVFIVIFLSSSLIGAVRSRRHQTHRDAIAFASDGTVIKKECAA